MISLFDYQKTAVDQLKTGSILCGGVGSGKSLTAIVYYYTKVCGGKIDEDGLSPMTNPRDLYIITTAAKRDTLDWERECAQVAVSNDREASTNGVRVIVDSWNNIKKYSKINSAFFIFDEQRVVGSGAWVKSFLKIARCNKWILLSATPGDTWMDYIPAFVANGFYKNRTEFLRTHVVYNSFTKYPKVDRYVEEGRLRKLKAEILVSMSYQRPTVIHSAILNAAYDVNTFDIVMSRRWNPYENKPLRDVSEFCYIMRKVVNSDPSRLEIVKDIGIKHQKVIIFYNFNYELDILRKLKDETDFDVAEYNGHKHEPLPKSFRWFYLVQYTSGAEGWNCIDTNVILFYSLNYSYRIMTQAAGRIDRLNTPFVNLYHYTIRSSSFIDMSIAKALKNKKTFNEKLSINIKMSFPNSRV